VHAVQDSSMRRHGTVQRLHPAVTTTASRCGLGWRYPTLAARSLILTDAAPDSPEMN
jgi:hypothetical protein